jgi:Zn-dependent peptidase ImmA (M78 family)
MVEHHGVLVVFSPVRAASVDAYSFNAHKRPVMVLNPVKRDYYRQRFDIAHELGHLVMHSDAEPGGRVVENQAHRFAAELLMPAAEIRDLLPSNMSSGTWRTLGQLKETWGVSMQALLHRARWLGKLSEVSYRNAMTTVSTRGWRRSEPGRINVIEQPSLLPKAVELLEQEGIDERQLLDQCRVPAHLFRIITARTPETGTTGSPAGDDSKLATVVSLLDYSRRNERTDIAASDRTTLNRGPV